MIVTSRSLNKNFTSYKYLKIQNQIKFEKLNANNKKFLERRKLKFILGQIKNIYILEKDINLNLIFLRTIDRRNV